MDISAELEKIIAKDAGNIESLEVTYPNGGIARGPIRNSRMNPLRIVITKTDTSGKPEGKHRIMFEHAVSLKIIFKSGEPREFPFRIP